MKQGCEQFS